MGVQLAGLVLAVLLVCAVECLLRPQRWTALTAIVLGAAWLPLNNQRLEGPVLLSVAETHGLTLADLVGIGSVLLGVSTLRRLARTGRVHGPLADRRVVLGLAALALVLGFGLASITGP